MLALFMTTIEDDDREKIKFLYDNYHSFVLSVARKLLMMSGDKNAALNGEDVAQNVFIKLTRYIDSVDFNSGASKMSTYIYTVTKNEVMNFLEKEKKHDESEANIENAMDDDDFFGALFIKERYAETVDIIRRLDDELKIPLILRFGFEKSVCEVAKITGKSERQIYYLIEKGKKTIIEETEKRGGKNE